MYKCLAPGMVGVSRTVPAAAELAGTHGFSGINVSIDYLAEHGPEQYRELLRTNDLRPGSIGLPVQFDASDAEYHSGVERLEAIVADVAALGCQRASTYLLPFSDERPFEENLAFHQKRIEPVARLLDSHDVRLGLEFVGTPSLRAGHEYPFIHTAGDMLELCDIIETDNVGLLLDSWHWYTSGGDTDVLRELEAHHVVDVHVNDAPDKRVEDQRDNERELPMSTGVIDIQTFLRELDRMGYDGPVTVEPFDDDLADMEDEAAVRATKAALDEAWALAFG